MFAQFHSFPTETNPLIGHPINQAAILFAVSKWSIVATKYYGMGWLVHHSHIQFNSMSVYITMYKSRRSWSWSVVLKYVLTLDHVCFFFFNFIEQHTYLEPMINHWIFYWNPLYFIGKGHLKLKTVLVGFCLSIFLGAAILHWTPRYFWENNTFFDWCLAGNLREWSIITSNNHPSNPQQPIHSLQDGAPKIAKLVSWFTSGLTMVYGR